MANYTATTNMTLEQAITNGSMVSGENLSINNGAIVTCNQTPSILIGQININDGKLLVDGVNITTGNMINFVGEATQSITINGQGMIEVNGAWFNIGTTDGTTSQVIDTGVAGNNYWDSAHCVDVIPMIQVETGRRITYDGESGTAPEVDDFLRKTSNKSVLGRIVEVNTTSKYIVVRYFTGSLVDNDDIQVRKVVDNSGPDLQVSWTAKVNHASGDIKEAGIYQEFGNCVVNGISEIANFHGGVGGFVFANVWQNTNITMGGSATGPGSLGGFVPPSGCNVRVPNVHFSQSNTTNYATNTTYYDGTAQESTRYELLTSNGGSVDLSICNVGSSWFSCQYAYSFVAEYVGSPIEFGARYCASKQEFNNCVVVQDPLNLGIHEAPFYTFDNLAGCDVINCMVVNGRTNIGMVFDTCFTAEVSGCIVTQPNVTYWSSYNVDGYKFTYCRDVTFKNNIWIGGDQTHSDDCFECASCTGFEIKNFIVSASQDETEQLIPDRDILRFYLSSNISIIGIEFLGSGTMKRNLTYFIDCFDIKIRAIGMIDDKVDFQNGGDQLVATYGSNDNIDIARCWKTNGGIEEVIGANAMMKNVIVQNCSGKYASLFRPGGLDNILFKGLHGGSGNPGGTNGISDNYTTLYGRQIHDGFRSDVIGYITCNLITPSATLDNTTILVGNPKFQKDGTMDMVNLDSIEIEMDYFAKGHVSFPGTFTSVIGGEASWGADEWTNVGVTFQWMLDGGAWNGVWLNAKSVGSWTGITGDIKEGFKLKYRFTATGTQTDMRIFVIDSVTSLAIQKANFYPIDQVECDVILNGIVVDSRYWIYDSDTSTELAEGTASSDPVTETVTVPGGTNLEIRVRKSSAVVKYLPFKTTAVTNTTEINVAIIQTEDGVAA